MFFSLLLHLSSSNLRIEDAPETYHPVGVFDILYGEDIDGNDPSITEQSSGVFCEIKVGDSKKLLNRNEPVELESLKTTIELPINGDSLEIKFKVENKDTNTKTFSIGAYYDISYFDNDYEQDRVTPVGTKSFYVDNPNREAVKMFHLFDSNNGYIGPDRIWYGDPYNDIINSDDFEDLEIPYYNNLDPLKKIESKDVAVAFSWNSIQIQPGESKVFGMKIAFVTNTPSIVVTEPEQKVYQTGETIKFLKVTVQNSNTGTIKVDCNNENIASKEYSSSFDDKFDVAIPSSFNYKPEKYCLDIYATTESIPTSSKQFCFNIQNVPVIENVHLKRNKETNKATLTCTIKDKDNKKKLYLYFDLDDAASNNYIDSFNSNGDSYQISKEVTISEQADAKYSLWVTTQSISTPTSKDGANSKSEITHLTVETEQPKNPEEPKDPKQPTNPEEPKDPKQPTNPEDPKKPDTTPKTSTEEEQKRAEELKKQQEKQKQTYIIVGAVVGSLVVVGIIAAVVVVMMKKSDNPPATEGGYQRDEQINP